MDSKSRIDILYREMYEATFSMMDSEPDLTGEDAGRIATACAGAMSRLLEKMWAHDTEPSAN